MVDELSNDTAYHWRVRLLYHPADFPYQQRSRWLTMPWNSWQEKDLCTPTATVTITVRVITYTYDGLKRLTAADYSTGESFAYDYECKAYPSTAKGTRLIA